jgi:phosphoglycolate phosphatase-like HAD superfamily hydrolase
VAVVHGTAAAMECGQRSGAGTLVGVLTGPHPAARLRAAGAGHVLSSFAELPGLLDRDVLPAGSG